MPQPRACASYANTFNKVVAWCRAYTENYHTPFDSTCGYPGEGPPKRGRRAGQSKRRAAIEWRNRFSGRTDSYNVQQTTSGTGGFSSTAQAQTSISSANNIYLDPYTVGGRFYEVAGLFGQYQIQRFSVEYTPFLSDSGVVATPGGSNTTPSYAHRTFAIVVLADPAFSLTTYAGIMSVGGKSFQTNRKGTYNFMSIPKDWKYTSTSTSSPTIIDERQASFGLLCFSFEDSSTASSFTYGSLALRWDAKFRVPMVPDIVSSPPRPPGQLPKTAGRRNVIDNDAKQNVVLLEDEKQSSQTPHSRLIRALASSPVPQGDSDPDDVTSVVVALPQRPRRAKR